MKSEKILFFYNSIDSRVNSKNKIELIFWSPSLLQIKPILFPIIPFLIWYIFHYLGIFENKKFSIAYIKNKNKILHRTLIFPKFYRFPFMKKQDLQLGDILTEKSFRGKGVASKVISFILEKYKTKNFWFLCNENNISSILIAHNNNFKLKGYGYKVIPFGLNIFSYYKLLKKY